MTMVNSGLKRLMWLRAMLRYLCSEARYKNANPVFLISDMHLQNKKYGNFISISRLTGKCAAQKKNFCSSSLWSY